MMKEIFEVAGWCGLALVILTMGSCTGQSVLSDKVAKCMNSYSEQTELRVCLKAIIPQAK